MALPAPDVVEAPRLTAQDKFRMIRIGGRAEVRLTERIGRTVTPQWCTVRVKNTHKGGAFCILASGKEQFFVWHDVRPPQTTPEKNQPYSTLGDVARFPAVEKTPLRALPPYLDQTPPPPPSEPRPAALLISREELSMPPKPTRQKLTHEFTPIGTTFREHRQGRGWSQLELGEKLCPKGTKQPNQIVSRIELGKSLPTDDQLLQFALLFNLDLDTLDAQRVGKTPAPKLVAVPAPPPTPPEPVPPTPREEWMERALETSDFAKPLTKPAATEPAAMLADFDKFTTSLRALSPLPADREKQRLWLRLAVRLFELAEP